MQSSKQDEDDGFFANQYNQIWKTVIEPKHSTFPKEMLGGRLKKVSPEYTYERFDGQCQNSRNQNIDYTFFRLSKDDAPLFTDNRCFIYLHSHGGNRVEGFSMQPLVADLGMNFCCFDFSACGYSEGTYCTLGMQEHEDIRVITKHLQQYYGISRFVIWGRSMGAVASLIFASYSPDIIDYMVLDSPFADMEQMVRDLGNNMVALGEYVSSFVFGLIKDEMIKRVSIDISGFRPIDYCKYCLTPCVFIAAKNDKLVMPQRVSTMLEEYQSNQKCMVVVNGDHTSAREMGDLRRVFQKIEDFYKNQPAKIGPVTVSRPIIPSKFSNENNTVPEYTSLHDNSLNQSALSSGLKPSKKITLAKNLKSSQMNFGSSENMSMSGHQGIKEYAEVNLSKEPERFQQTSGLFGHSSNREPPGMSQFVMHNRRKTSSDLQRLSNSSRDKSSGLFRPLIFDSSAGDDENSKFKPKPYDNLMEKDIELPRKYDNSETIKVFENQKSKPFYPFQPFGDVTPLSMTGSVLETTLNQRNSNSHFANSRSRNSQTHNFNQPSPKQQARSSVKGRIFVDIDPYDHNTEIPIDPFTQNYGKSSKLNLSKTGQIDSQTFQSRYNQSNNNFPY